jgi:hypothetical protein
MSEDLLFAKLSSAVDAFQQKMEERREDMASLGQNKMVVRLSELLGTKQGDKEIRTIFDGLRYMGESGEVDMLDQKTNPEDRLERNITFSTPFHPYKLGLQLFHGFRDASVEVGHMEKTA